MAVSRRTFLAASATAFLAACSKAARRVAGKASQPSTSAAAPATTETTLHTGPADVVYSGPRDRKQVALTFHGSGDPALTIQLLAEAKRLQAPITVFAVGTWLQQHP
jgi:peptidoglycan/xylan/chitin deacetylase (PgdA/CDA1 family)